MEEPLFEWETLKPAEWPQEDLAAAEELGHRARRRKREAVRVAVEADAAKRAEAERQRAEARTQKQERAERGGPRARGLSKLLRLVTTVVVTLVLWPRETAIRGSVSDEKQEGGSSYVGDTALMSAETPSTALSGRRAGVEDLPKPLPDQLKPDAKSQCRKGLHAINGGCWMKVALEECREDGFAYFIYKGTCYLPVFPRTRRPTSAQ